MGGAINYSIALARKLIQKGIITDIISTADNEVQRASALDSVSNLTIAPGSVDGSMMMRGLKALHKLGEEIERQHFEKGYDVIHIHSGSFYYARTLAHRTVNGAKLVHSIYCPVLHEKENRVRRIFELVAFRLFSLKIDRFIAVTRNVEKSLRKTGIQPGKVVYIPMGVDIPTFRARVDTNRYEYFAENRNVSRLLFIGNTSTEKGLETLIRALGQLKRIGFAFDFIAALENQSSRPELDRRKKKIEGLVRKLELKSCVRFLGVVPKVQALIRRADMVIFPFQNTPTMKGISDYPMTLLESMACGRCVVTTPFGGVPEIVKHNISGILSKSFDATDIANAVSFALTRPQLRESFGTNAREIVSRNFSMELISSRLINFYENLIGN